jgi:hypothetical protein
VLNDVPDVVRALVNDAMQYTPILTHINSISILDLFLCQTFFTSPSPRSSSAPSAVPASAAWERSSSVRA